MRSGVTALLRPHLSDDVWVRRSLLWLSGEDADHGRNRLGFHLPGARTPDAANLMNYRDAKQEPRRVAMRFLFKIMSAELAPSQRRR